MQAFQSHVMIVFHPLCEKSSSHVYEKLSAHCQDERKGAGYSQRSSESYRAFDMHGKGLYHLIIYGEV